MKRLLCMFAAVFFATMPVFAAEGARTAVNGELQDREEPDAGYVFRENGRAMLPVRWLAGQCGITKESGAGKIPLVQAIAENAGLRMRWDTDTRTAYFMDQERVLYENEVRENFPISYSEVYRDQDGIWLCVNVSDVQAAPEDEKQKAEYEKHLAYKEEICASFYTFTE